MYMWTKNLTPKDMVNKLNKYIIGQKNAKKSIAIAIRNRWRRLQLNSKLKNDIIPKNIIMIGSTGVGKTEIVKQLAKLINVPYIKVEATKYTEVGFVGKDVDSMIEELVQVAVIKIKKQLLNQKLKLSNKLISIKLFKLVITQILNTPKLLFKIINYKLILFNDNNQCNNKFIIHNNFKINLLLVNKIIHRQLNSGILDNLKLEFNYNNNSNEEVIEIFSPYPESSNSKFPKQFKNLFLNITNNIKQNIQKLKVKEIKEILIQEQVSDKVHMNEINKLAVKYVEETGIIFIDEIDKICRTTSYNHADISNEGVQRDLLPLIEGCVVKTKFGNVNTNHILFITAGAFQQASITDLLPELQGRLPIKIYLDNLTQIDFANILIKTKNSLLKQYQALLKTENINIIFSIDSIKYLAQLAWELNTNSQNIGARQLYVVLENVIEELSFNIHKYIGKKIIINKTFIKKYFKYPINNNKLKDFII